MENQRSALAPGRKEARERGSTASQPAREGRGLEHDRTHDLGVCFVEERKSRQSVSFTVLHEGRVGQERGEQRRRVSSRDTSPRKNTRRSPPCLDRKFAGCRAAAISALVLSRVRVLCFAKEPLPGRMQEKQRRGCIYVSVPSLSGPLHRQQRLLGGANPHPPGTHLY